MRLLRRALTLLALTAAVGARACDTPAGFQRLESRDVVVAYRTVPAAIAIGQHFAIEAVVCAKSAAFVPTGLRVDATMPEHRHGMNYRPTVSPTGGGRYLAEGLLFHMPGRWQLVLEVESKGRRERLTKDLVVE